MVVKENNDENSGPLTSLPVDRLTATDCNAAARAELSFKYAKTKEGCKVSFWVLGRS